MKKEDLIFLADMLENSHLLFYGELEYYLDKFLKRVFEHDFREYGFEEIKMSDDFATAYWLIISWFEKEELVEYGTSPRGCWLTEKGKRFKKIIIENETPITDAQKFI